MDNNLSNMRFSITYTPSYYEKSIVTNITEEYPIPIVIDNILTSIKPLLDSKLTDIVSDPDILGQTVYFKAETAINILDDIIKFLNDEDLDINVMYRNIDTLLNGNDYTPMTIYQKTKLSELVTQLKDYDINTIKDLLPILLTVYGYNATIVILDKLFTTKLNVLASLQGS